MLVGLNPYCATQYTGFKAKFKSKKQLQDGIKAIEEERKAHVHKRANQLYQQLLPIKPDDISKMSSFTMHEFNKAYEDNPDIIRELTKITRKNNHWTADMYEKLITTSKLFNP